ncbi:MAG: PIN domain-containing protein [bacterium]|nr:PIN domain-containing protein [bacterium]
MRPLWLDANVLIRFLTRDQPEQARAALAVFLRAKEGEFELRLCPLVVAEAAWVLDSYYGFSRRQISQALVSLIMAEGVVTQDGGLLVSALGQMEDRNVPFVDAFLAELVRTHGEAVCSFDRDFDRLGVERVSPSALL